MPWYAYRYALEGIAADLEREETLHGAEQDEYAES